MNEEAYKNSPGGLAAQSQARRDMTIAMRIMVMELTIASRT
jgi:hypothetical protein